MLKDFQVDLELSPRDNRVIQTGATYWSHDVNTAKINIKLLRHSEPVVLNKDVTVRVMMLFDDENKSEHIYTAKIEDEKAGIVSVILDKNVRSYVGQVICGVYADYGAEQKTDNGYFTFAMKRSLIDKRMPEMKQYYVSDFEDTLAKMKLANAEFAEVETKLNNRIDVIEKDIVSNEVVKKNTFEKLKNDYDKMNIGGENIALNSKGPLSTANGTENFELKLPIEPGEYVVSFELDLKNGRPGTQSRIGVDCIGVMENGQNVYFGAWHNLSDGTDFNGVVTATKYIPSKITRINTAKVYDTLIEADKKEITKIRIQRGNRDGGWSRSSDELQKQIDEIKKAITNLGGTL